MKYVYDVLNVIMNWCYSLCGNYGWAIVLFTFCTKLVLLPLSLWTYFNGITMVKIQPDINFIKVKFYGQKDRIAEEQAKLFKEKKYRPLLSVIPTVMQLFLLMGVVGVIKMGMADPLISMKFYSVDLGQIPSDVGIGLIWSPLVAGGAAFILCVAQNASSVLQAEQSKMNKYGMTCLSVGLSLYLGWFVAIGTAFYWVCSNLMAVLQLYICNWIFRPRRYVDYEKLEQSRQQLAELQQIGKKKRKSYFSSERKKERADYKRFFKVVNKHLVFYSESNGFYKYYKGFIEYILKNTNMIIHYITSDINDDIFQMEKTNSNIRAYYIGENKLITLMMKMEADVVVMTMPDLDNFHIKRSYYRKDIEYIFVQHGMGSNNMGMRRGCTDHFDTIFLCGIHQREEEEQIGELYGVQERKLIDIGYPLLDELQAEYREKAKSIGAIKKILIAPSWQKDNIIDSCLEQLLDALKDKAYEVTVRPHPQEVRMKNEYMETLKNKYEPYGIQIQTDFSSNSTIWESDLLITDWSGISWEYAFTTLNPILFINTPMKVMNPDYQKISAVPLNISLRSELGMQLNLDELDQTADVVETLLNHAEQYHQNIERLLNKYIYNLGSSAEVGGKYIINTIQEKIKRRKENETSN